MRGLFAGLAATAVAPRVVYADSGRSVTAAQAKTYGRIQHEGRLDPAAPSGSYALPEAVRADGPRRPGAYFVDRKGREQYEPTAAEREEARARFNGHVMRSVEAFGRGVDDRARAFARGVPVLGGLADEMNAATSASVDHMLPGLEPAIARAPEPIRGWLGYDPKREIEGNTWGERYQSALSIQHQMDADFDRRRPVTSAALRGAGAVAGTIAGASALGPATAATSSGGLGARTLAGMTDGALIGAVDGYAQGEGSWTSPARASSTGEGTLFGAAAGAAGPIISDAAAYAWRSGRQAFNDAVRPKLQSLPHAKRSDEFRDVIPGPATHYNGAVGYGHSSPAPGMPPDLFRPPPDTFRGGSYIGVDTIEPTTLFRVRSPRQSLSPYFSTEPPHGPLASKLDLSLHPNFGNNAEDLDIMVVPPGHRLYAGRAAPVGDVLVPGRSRETISDPRTRDLHYWGTSGPDARVVGGGVQVHVPSPDPKWIVKK